MQTRDIVYLWYDAIPLYLLVIISFIFFPRLFETGFNHD